MPYTPTLSIVHLIRPSKLLSPDKVMPISDVFVVTPVNSTRHSCSKRKGETEREIVSERYRERLKSAPRIKIHTNKLNCWIPKYIILSTNFSILSAIESSDVYNRRPIINRLSELSRIIN